MSLPGSLKRRALAAGVVGQLALVAAALVGDGSLLVAAPAAGLAIVGMVAWAVREDAPVLYAAAGVGVVPAFAGMVLPADVAASSLVLVGVLGWLAFVEHGHLAHRVEAIGSDEDALAALDAMRSRLTRVLALASVATVAVVAGTAFPGPWFPDHVALSVELAGPLGVLGAAGTVAALLLAAARIRARAGGRTGETG